VRRECAPDLGDPEGGRGGKFALMNELGPLAGLAGEWEGDQGLDVSYHHDVGKAVETPYREKLTFKPFGPVDNGAQRLYGLDYKSAMWRGDEEAPFHTELGYWLWDAGLGHVMRAFVIPRGSAILAGGEVAADAAKFTLRAESGSPEYGMATNPYLLAAANCVRYEVTIEVGDGEFSYTEDSVLQMAEFDDLYHHLDSNTLLRTEVYELAL
jgi:hypothetical protein